MPIYKECENKQCNNTIKTYPSRIKRGEDRFCSHKCGNHSRGRSGEQNGNWRGGRFISNGYVYLRYNGGYRAEHDILIEQSIGRKLKKGEEVHHINGVKTDNRLENLQLVTKSEHAKLHYDHKSHRFKA